MKVEKGYGHANALSARAPKAIESQETNPLIIYASMAGDVEALLTANAVESPTDRRLRQQNICANAMSILRASSMDVAIVAGSMNYLAKSKPKLAAAMRKEFYVAAQNIIVQKIKG
jgi:hypothetical protein